MAVKSIILGIATFLYPLRDIRCQSSHTFSHRNLTSESEIERLSGFFVGNLIRRGFIFMCAWWQLAQEERSSLRSYTIGYLEHGLHSSRIRPHASVSRLNP